MQLRKLGMLLMILSLAIGCSSNRKIKTGIKNPNSVGYNYRPGASRTLASCDVVLEKCKTAVDKQKEAIKKQADVIEHQKLIIEHAEEEVDRSHKATDRAVKGGIGVSGALLLLLLL